MYKIIKLNTNIKNELGVVVVAMILVTGVLTFSLLLTSHLQSVDAKKDTKKDKDEKLTESLREIAQEAGITERNFANIFGGNVSTSLATTIAEADGINGCLTNCSVNGTDGADGIDAGIDGANGADGGIGMSTREASSAAGGADGIDGGIDGTDGADAPSNPACLAGCTDTGGAGGAGGSADGSD